MSEAKRAYERGYYEKNKEVLRAKKRDDYYLNSDRYYTVNRRSVVKRKYGITMDDVERLKAEQNFACKICKKPEVNKTLAIDHDHKTGVVRGLLCGNCNRALGLFQDDLNLLESAKQYLIGE